MTTSKGREHASLVKWLALCGIIAVILYNLVIFIAGSLSPRFDFVYNTISSLGFEGSPVAWFFNPLGPMLYGVLIILFSIGLFIGRVGRVGSFFLVIYGVGSILIGLYPITIETIILMSTLGFHPYIVGMLALVIGIIVTLFAFAVSMRRRDAWKNLWVYTLVSAIILTALSLVDVFHIYSFAGALSQIILSWIVWLWILIVAHQLYRIHT